ncbi:MetQ/NlpA family ABC transporter substrate-binding protein [Paludibacterium paludis]|uniref:Methionine ABC transporter substrate-binding protein n=1 Tax=Paludibacterium paludis TaxID=1225769 RepID=A0A918U6Y2_9NEIS|nr:MetQ/NlpA family ABC transporter substrate-binding protein [Paludibacterium paludis]GGY02343.1 methionine ABC transporter substrate-binding protein [Paludibacterium paludis]
MKRRTFTAALLASALLSPLAHAQPVKLTVAASPVPHAQILEALKPQLARQGVELDVKVFNDYVLPNTQVEEKRIDANFFQHIPYLTEFNKNRGTHLVVASKAIHIEPFGGYSTRIKKLADLPSGATIAIPNDPTNAGRALALLAQNGVISLKNPNAIASTVKDITANPKKVVIRELEAATLPRVLGQVDLALINANYALEAKLVPTRDALFLEKKTPYANLLVARPDNKDSDAVKKLAAALASPEARKFIEEKYKGSVIPAF